MKRLYLAALAACLLGGCSTVMEASRPDPVNLSKFSVGEKRVDVISQLGAPKTTVDSSGHPCDVYEEFTKGVSKVGKGAIIFTEAAADVLTLGLTEVVATPAEAMTKNKKHTVLMCYDPGGVLATVSDDGSIVVPPPPPTATTPASAPTTTASAAAPAAKP